MRTEITHIHWNVAVEQLKHKKDEDQVRAKKLIEEIETSNFEICNYADMDYYARELNDCITRVDKNGKEKPYTPNCIREMNMDAQGLNRYDMINTFIDSDSDDIIDFF